MSVEIVINQLDEHNEGSILISKKLSPKKVYYILSRSDKETMNSIERYYRENLSNIQIESIFMDEGDVEGLESFISKLKDKNVLINITGGKRINALILLQLAIKYSIKSVYIDIRNKKVYEFNKEIKLTNVEFEDLEITDLIEAAGGKIVEDSSNLCNKKDLVYFSKTIYNNLSLWHKYKQKLYDNTIFSHDIDNPKVVYVHTNNLKEEEKQLIDKIINKLQELNEITVKRNGGKIIIEFRNEYIKGFIFKSGTWLEIATKNLINKITEIDEAKNGVVFLWNDENMSVRNEVDVVAVRDSVPICISCKDSDKYNENALNELNVYAEKIGGDNAIKILVATKKPIKSPVGIRAKEMGIHLVIFDGDENKFINTIKSIIKTK